MLRNMHYSTDIEQIKKELCELGHEVIHVQNVLQSGTKKPLSLFAIELKTNKNNKDIYSINNLLHCKINFEPPHQKRSLPQCTNCQKYGHTKNFCTKSPVCVKCAGSHKTIQCLIKQKSDHIKCALCGEKHTANYKGCMVYKELRVKRFPPLRKKENEPKSSEAKEHNDVHQINQNINAQERSKNNPGLTITYAQAIKAKNTANITQQIPTTSSSTVITPNIQQSNNDMQDIKDMMKQLITQVSNMMNIITVLLSKIDGQTK